MDVIAVGNANIDNLVITEKLAEQDEKVPIKKFIRFAGGGAANFAVSISRLGKKVGFIGCIGDDENGKFFIESIRSEGVDTTFLKILSGYITGFTLIFNTEKGEHVMYTYRGANNELSITEDMVEYISKAKILHLASIKQKVIEQAVSVKEKTGILLSVDPGKTTLLIGYDKLKYLFRNIDLLFINRVEFKAFVGSEPTEDLVHKIAKELNIILSVQLGDRGSFVSNGEKTYHIPSFKIKNILDTTAAGDAYAAGFIFGLLNKLEVKDCAFLGHAVAALKIQKIGTQKAMPYLNDLKNFLREQKVEISI
ncbi:MAG: carbohydrate kinase family protein [Candidatus Odinarchaeota archaeon]|nr:carbohydrate kinase family protein [Candidatus Odinarchaeota archaeon]